MESSVNVVLGVVEPAGNTATKTLEPPTMTTSLDEDENREPEAMLWHWPADDVKITV